MDRYDPYTDKFLRDTQYDILGTNLAEVGTGVPDINVGELISRQQAVDALRKMQTYKLFSGDDMLLIDQAGAQTELMLLPPARPEIVRCKDCLYQRICSWKKQGAKFCSFAEKREVTE